MIKEYEHDLSYIQNKIEKGKIAKAEGKKARPYKTAMRDTVNEDCLNISLDHHHLGAQGGGDYMGVIGDKESSIHGGGEHRNDFLGEMSESSLSMLGPMPHVPHTSGPKSKMSASQKSSAKGKKKKSTTSHSNMDKLETGSVSSKTSKLSKATGGLKKKKKKDGKDDKSDAGDGSDTARSKVIAEAPPVEEVKVEEPVIPERPRKQFIQPEKITLMD